MIIRQEGHILSNEVQFLALIIQNYQIVFKHFYFLNMNAEITITENSDVLQISCKNDFANPKGRIIRK